MKLTTLINKAKASSHHKVTYESSDSVTLNRNFDTKWTVKRANDCFIYAQKEMAVGRKVFSVQQLAAYLNLK
jgi:hypothetical protein